MKQRLHILTILLCLLCTAAGARPAKSGPITLQQPDGSTFGAYFRGDEFMRIKTTAAGHAIIQDEEGWWCYARYDSNGDIFCSGCRVGGTASPEVLSGSLQIPYAKLAGRAAAMRSIGDRSAEKLLGQQKPPTRACDEVQNSRHGLVILAQYQDIKFSHGRNSFVNMLTQDGYNVNGATGSAKEYFEGQFGDDAVFSFTVSEIVTLSKRRSYYGGNDADGKDKNAAEMIAEACRLADKEIDFSLFDDDGDGTVDNVFVFFAGEDEAEGADENCIWSHAWYIFRGADIDLTLDGKQIDRYACTSELTRIGATKYVLAGIGTFCHEYSHTFGLPDFYDTDYDEAGGWAAGLWGSTSLMDSGNQNNNGNTPPYFNAIEREILGIGKPVMIENDGTYILEPVSAGGEYLKMDTDTPGEYYLFECRSNDGWDAHTGGNGLLVYHIDKSSPYTERWTSENTVNAYSSHQCADLVEADGREDSFADQYHYQSLMRNIKGIFFPYGTTTSLTPKSSPGLKFWSGAEGEASITDIRRDGNRIIFNVIGYGDNTTPPSAANLKADVFSDAAVITFESSKPYSGEATVTWGRTSQGTTTVKVAPYRKGKYALHLENLVPDNKTYTVSVHFTAGEIKGESKALSFMTTRRPPVKWPYMYLGKSSDTGETIKTGTRVPLRVYNAAGASEIRWTFNGKDIAPEPDGRFTIPSGGILRAYVTWENGTTDIIEKNIPAEAAK